MAAILLCFLSCSKPGDTNPDTPDQPSAPPDLTTTVATSVNGYVTYRNGNTGISGATVTLGNRTVITDKYGYFEFRDVQVVKEAAALSVVKGGFLKTIKTFIVSEGRATFLRVGLFPVDRQGAFFASVGGGYYDTHGISITIPGNAMVHAITKQPYTGDVIMQLRYFLRRGGEYTKLPGDDRGIDSLGAVKWLDSYGVVSIECKGSGGEPLELAPGKTATLKIALLFGTASSAPPFAPMWYFDEAKALWRQQGTAIKAGDYFVAQVSSLANWNVAQPYDLVRFRCTLTDPSLKPIPYTWIVLEEVGSQSDGIPFVTDSSGQVLGFIPDGKRFSLRYTGCMPTGVVKSFTTTGSDVSLGNIVVPATNVATVSGTLVNCNGQPVTNGYVMLAHSGRIMVNSTGQFSFPVLVCGDPVSDYIRIIPEDLTTGQTGNAIQDTLQVGVNNYGTLSVCGTELLESFSATLQDAGGQPLPDVWVRVSNLSRPQDAPFWYLPSPSGMINGQLPRNTRFLMEVFSSENCGTPAFTQTFASVNAAVQLGVVPVTGLRLATVSGTVTDCNGQAATGGYMFMKKGRKTFSIPLGTGGSFHFTTPVCNGTNTEEVSLLALSNATYTISNMINISLTSGNNTMGAFSACATPASSGEYVHYILDGVPHAFVSPDDNITQTDLYPGIANFNNIRANSPQRQDGISLTLLGDLDRTVAGDVLILDEFNFPGYDREADYPVPIYMTESGSIGQYISGHLTVPVRNKRDNSIHSAVCIFRVKRRE
ncbi:carboxypeptidase regulatory-like domain-containing protein [Flavisolibacter sp. BT320]|nr:carboxypeptidase regulatory-like domain-containing protein [Flavisolibacter longurius]